MNWPDGKWARSQLVRDSGSRQPLLYFDCHMQRVYKTWCAPSERLVARRFLLILGSLPDGSLELEVMTAKIAPRYPGG